MNRMEQVALFLQKKPNATNKDIAYEMDITEGYAKKIVHDLKACGAIEVKKEGDERVVEVFMDKIKAKRTNDHVGRRERVEQLLDIVFEHLEHETQFDNIVAAGHLIVKLLDRL